MMDKHLRSPTERIIGRMVEPQAILWRRVGRNPESCGCRCRQTDRWQADAFRLSGWIVRSTMRASKICIWVVAVAVALCRGRRLWPPGKFQRLLLRSGAFDRLQDGKYKGAIADFERVINIRPKYTDAYINRADAKIGLGLYEEAVADFDQALQLQPDDASAYYQSGRMQSSELGQYQEAIADFDQAIQLRTRRRQPPTSVGAMPRT